MELNIDDIKNGKLNGKIIYVCDYRYNDFNDKPIRHVEPTKVLVRCNSELPANKRIYYSDSHLIVINKKDELTSKILGMVDNTGYRSLPGHPVRAFDNLEECNQAYKEFVLKNLEQFQTYKTNTIAHLNKIEKDLKDRL